MELTKEQLSALEKWSALAAGKAGLLLVGSIGTLLATLLPEAWPMRIALLVIVALLTFSIWLAARCLRLQKEKEMYEAGLSKSSDKQKEQELTEAAFAILCMASDAFPERLTADEFCQRLHLNGIDVQLALNELLKNGFLLEPEGGLQIGDDDPNPDGYQITDRGARHVKEGMPNRHPSQPTPGR